MDINNILRASAVKRWHIVNTAKVQTLAEHTFNVTMMARDICRRMGIDDTPAIKIALEHDLDEVVFGDIPSPGKFLMGIDVPYRGKYFSLDSGIDGIYHDIVKVCDLIDATIFITEYAIDSHGKAVAESMEDELADRVNALRPESLKSSVKAMLIEMVNSRFEGLDRARG